MARMVRWWWAATSWLDAPAAGWLLRLILGQRSLDNLGVFFDLSNDRQGQVQSPQTRCAVHSWRPSRLDAIDKLIQLGRQRIAFRDGRVVKLKPTRASRLNREQLLFGEIERVVLVRLKEPQFASKTKNNA